VAPQTGSHDELIAILETLYEFSDVAKVVRAVRIAENDVLSTDKWKRVDICTSEAASWNLQHSGAFGEGKLEGASL